MPARDIFHNAVVESLEKEDWLVTNDPLFIESGGIRIYIDLGAEKVIVAERGEDKIAIEIKTFGNPSLVSAFHEAVGQYLNYRAALKEEGSVREMYLGSVID